MNNNISTSKKAPLVLKNATYLNVYSREFLPGDIAISGNTILGVGSYTGKKEIDMTGKFVVPGFIDAHIHLESTSVQPWVFAPEALSHGTCTVITDPHEITNVMGCTGIDYMLEATKRMPLDVYFTLPSCVPSCPLDESGATVEAKDLRPYWKNPRVLGLAEIMNVPEVLTKDPVVMKKIDDAKEARGILDGHAPGLSGEDLQAYVSAGITSDHECATMEEAIEKIQAGLWIMIREGTAAKNLEALVGLCKKPYCHRTMFCADDRHIDDMVEEGHIDYIIRKAISLGANPETVYTMASYNAARYFQLKTKGALAAGHDADLLVLSDVETCAIDRVMKAGEFLEITQLRDKVEKIFDLFRSGHTVSEGEPDFPLMDLSAKGYNTFHRDPLTPEELRPKESLPVIGLTPGQLLTTREGTASEIDVSSDILKICVVERHHNTHHVGVGYIKGYGLKSGAVATSVAHDAHNIIAVGTSDRELCAAVNHVLYLRGGMVVIKDGEPSATYPLPMAGLLSVENAEDSIRMLKEIHTAARAQGVAEGIDPFMTLSFTALPVIPEIKITTHGVVNVSTGELL